MRTQKSINYSVKLVNFAIALISFLSRHIQVPTHIPTNLRSKKEAVFIFTVHPSFKGPVKNSFPRGENFPALPPCKLPQESQILVTMLRLLARQL